MKRRRIIVAGGRDFDDYKLLRNTLNWYLASPKSVDEVVWEQVTIVSGCANGADTLGLKYAKEFKHRIKRFPADWDTYGKSAGPLRNAEMGKYADELVAFWDGKSRGTKDMIDRMLRRKKKVCVVFYGKDSACS